MKLINRDITLAKTIFMAGLVLSSAVIALYLIHPSFIRFVNDKATDTIMTLSQETAPAPGSVVFVDLDEKSLERYGQWPWPRFRLAQLLHKIKGLGAKSVGLDLILSEPDRTSPRNWQSEIAHELGYQIDISKVPPEMFDHDQYLAEVLAQGPFVLGFEFLFKREDPQKSSCALHPLQVTRVSRSNKGSDGVQYYKAHSAVCNLPVFAHAVAHSGFLNATPDSDGILRRVPLMIQYEDQLYPSFPLATLMQYEKPAQLFLYEEKSGLVYLSLNDRRIPIDDQGNLLINFDRPAKTLPQISAADVLGGTVPPDMFSSKIVLVGSSAAGWQQTYQVINRPVVTSGDILGQILENLVARQLITRPRVFIMWETLAGLLITTLLCLGIVKLGILGSAVVGMLCLSGVWLAAWSIFQINGFLFSPFLPTVLVITNFGFLTIYKSRKKQHFASQRADDTLVLLKNSEGSLNSIIQTIPDIVFRLDPAGNITFISPAISRYSARPEDILGQPILELVPTKESDKARYRLTERRTGKRATSGLELQMLLYNQENETDGGGGYFSVSAEGIYNRTRSGEKIFIGTQGIMRDITDQKNLENKLVQAQKMEAIGNLAAGIAHDLNNILSGLVGYPDLLLLDLPPDSPIREDVLKIQQSGQKAAAIVQDLLALARRSVKIEDVVDLNSMVTDYLGSPEYDNLKQAHPKTRLVTELSSDLMHIKGSSVHLSKVLMNILNNALEAMPAGGCIHLFTFNIYLDSPRQGYEEIPEGEYVCLRISDEGVGIDPDDLKRVFEPFYTKKMMQRSGTGLGMTVIWATIKDHAGYIDIQSSADDGTCMELYLPATREVADPGERRMVLEDYVGNEHLLIVDDVPDQLRIAVKMLSKLGYQVSSVSSGEEAVAFIREHEVDLLVLDMIMPGGIDGLETYRRIIEIHAGQKAIIASGFSESERVKTLQGLGAGAYIQKPYTLEKIGVAVRHELDRQS
jgi:two-component system, cell cycle sensor histidine kinase and response regulator CckA